jgi:hypothetical protein
MERRAFLKSSTALLGTFSFAGMQPFGPLHSVPPADEEVVKIKIGAMQCTIFRDFLFKYQAKDFFINADPQELAQALARYGAASGTIPSPFIAVLLLRNARLSMRVRLLGVVWFVLRDTQRYCRFPGRQCYPAGQR